MSNIPSNTEAWDLWLESITGGHHPASLAKFARAVLAKWGTPQLEAVGAGGVQALSAALAEQQTANKAAPGEPSAFPMTGDEEESDLGQWQPGTTKPNMDGTYLREFDEGEATSEFHQGVWLRDGFFPSDLQDVRWRGRAAPQQEAQEPAAWESTILGYIKYITQAQYEKFRPNVRRWYKPYKCSSCAAPQPSPAPLTDAQIAEMMRGTWGCASIAPRNALEFARAVERAHGITQKGGS